MVEMPGDDTSIIINLLSKLCYGLFATFHNTKTDIQLGFGHIEDGPHQLIERWFADANIFVANPFHRFIAANYPLLTDTEITTGVAFEKRSRGNFVCHSTELERRLTEVSTTIVRAVAQAYRAIYDWCEHSLVCSVISLVVTRESY